MGSSTANAKNKQVTTLTRKKITMFKVTHPFKSSYWFWLAFCLHSTQTAITFFYYRSVHPATAQHSCAQHQALQTLCCSCRYIHTHYNTCNTYKNHIQFNVKSNTCMQSHCSCSVMTVSSRSGFVLHTCMQAHSSHRQLTPASLVIWKNRYV